MLEQGAGDQRPERGDRAAERRPQRDRLRPARPRPQCGDQGERRRETPCPRPRPPRTRAAKSRTSRRERGQQTRGDREPASQQQHHLAPVAVAQRAEVEHRRGEAERVADRDQVEPRLPGVEGLADVRQGDVGDERFRLATPATRISAVRTSCARSGALRGSARRLCERTSRGRFADALVPRLIPSE